MSGRPHDLRVRVTLRVDDQLLRRAAEDRVARLYQIEVHLRQQEQDLVIEEGADNTTSTKNNDNKNSNDNNHHNNDDNNNRPAWYCRKWPTEGRRSVAHASAAPPRP